MQNIGDRDMKDKRRDCVMISEQLPLFSERKSWLFGNPSKVAEISLIILRRICSIDVKSDPNRFGKSDEKTPFVKLFCY